MGEPEGQLSPQERIQAQLRIQRQMGGTVPQSEGGKPPWKVTVRRVIALVIDGIFLIGLGRLIAFVAGPHLAPLGEGGWWIGLVIAWLFFALFDGHLGQGKSPGKRLMRIEVRHLDGRCLRFFEALLRFFPLAALIALGFILRDANPFAPRSIALGIAALLLLLALTVFGLAHPHRRSLHDLLVRSIVVKSERAYQLEAASLRTPLIIFIAVGFFLVAAEVGAGLFLLSLPGVQKINRLWRVLEARTDIHRPSLHREIIFNGKAKPVDVIAVRAFVSDPHLMADVGRLTGLTRDIADSLARSGALPGRMQQIRVTLQSGFDIGIWREMTTFSRSYPAVATSSDGSPTVIYKTTSGKSRSGGVKAPPGKAPPPAAQKPRGASPR